MGTKTITAGASAEAGSEQVLLTIDEFCARKSETMKRPELLGAFAHVEQVAGNVRDTAEAFEQRLEDFRNKPV